MTKPAPLTYAEKHSGICAVSGKFGACSRYAASAVAAVILLALGAGCASTAPESEAETATLVLLNGRIWTADTSRPWAEGLAVRGDRLLAVGSNEEIRALIGDDTRLIDAEGGFVTPGLIDTHVHFLEGGCRLSSVQLRDAGTPEEFTERIAAFAQTVPPGTWIVGGDWDHERWGGELPHRDWIDEVTPDHPVWVNRLDGHMALANTLALEAAGVTRATAEVDGGTIVRDVSGVPTGVLKDNAMGLVDRAVPDPTDAMQDRALDAAMQYVAQQGVTSVHHMGTWDDLEVFDRARRGGRLKTRIYAAVPLSTWERLVERVVVEGRGDEWLRIGALKGFVDGSLGSHTAAFFEPFADAPADTGLLVNDPDDLRAWITGADAAGLYPVVHAIGDRANHVLLDLFEEAIDANGQRSDRRFRIEHAQHLSRGDIPRFAELGVIASMQPYHAIDDGRWAEKVIGPERIKTTYAFRSLLDAGARVVFGSDWFVAPPTPLEGIYAALTRRTIDGANPGGWVPQEKITAEEALRAYTIDAAYASFEEDIKGSLEPGKLADFVVFDGDITVVALGSIPDIGVKLTVVGGVPVFEADSEAQH